MNIYTPFCNHENVIKSKLVSRMEKKIKKILNAYMIQHKRITQDKLKKQLLCVQVLSVLLLIN